ncbi:MAG: tricarballylate utilization 4Fe-4S protein TcuB [Rubrivivax sp.]|nr:tricarballylate utilization 4Fe-4S protein TcuB [Rubrivivax sp.]
MQPLEALVREAQALADPTAEVARVMTICNACRYCEGFCAVFPAMTRRIEFPAADVHFLANLCHNCGACLHACQYAPPHDFQLNVPQAMARVRATTYADYAWPPAFGRLYQRNGLTLSVALAAGLALFLVLAVVLNGSGISGLWRAVPGADFYAIFPHNLMVALFLPVFAFAVLALGIGVTRFWRLAPPGAASGAAVAEATRNVLTLKFLDGGHGDGCNNEDDAFTHRRRHAHHATFYGFMLCFAATSVGTLYHYAFGWVAPYAYLSLPKLLGTVGGVLMAVGTVSLWRLNRRRHPLQGDAAQKPMDLGFIALLFGTAVTGLVLTVLRASPALPLLLAVHLGVVLALFATLPYGKFAHGVYRGAALLKWAVEKRRPLTLNLGSD